MLQEKNGNIVWIGATDHDAEGTWLWSDCSAWNFTKWFDNQPDNGKNKENCVVSPSFQSNWKGWHDLSCNGRLPFVCKRPICQGEKVWLSSCRHTFSSEELPLSSKANGESSATNEVVLVSAVSSGFAILFFAVLTLIICKHRRRNRSTSVEENDENPVYGMYYFADGNHIDDGTSEVQDDNSYYGT